MIIAVYSRIKIDRVLDYAIWIAGIAAGISFFFGIFIVGFLPWESQERLLEPKQQVLKKDPSSIASFASIGNGPLALRCSAFCPFVMRLKEEVLILGQNTRPDVDENQAELLVQLKSACEKKIVPSGTFVYLKEEENLIRFSEEPTDFWIRPLFSEGNALLLEAKKEEEKGQWLIKVSEDLGKKIAGRFWDKEPPVFVQAMKEGKFWGADLLVQQYAGEEHKGLRDKYKLLLGSGVYFISRGDCLVWSDKGWEVSDLRVQDAPIAVVKNISSRAIELDVWDESGFQKFSLKLEGPNVAKMGSGHADQVPTTIRLRTSSQVACTLGKRRLILKEGDWLMRTLNGWRKLKTPQDIENCLFHRIRGELLIFDRLEKQQSKTILHAHLFDEMRTQVQTLSIPVTAEKKKTSGGKL